MTGSSSNREEFRVNGEEVLAKIKELIKAGNARRIILQNEKGETLIEIPLTFAAVGAIAALVTKCTIIVEKK